MVERSAKPFLICRLPTRVIGLPLEDVVETMRPLGIEVLPGAPPHVIGLSVIRGVPAPVVDVGRLLGEVSTPPGRYVTVRAGGRTVALAVDSVVGVRTIPTDSLHALPPMLRDAGAEAVAEIAILDAELLLMLHGARIVPEISSTADPGELSA